MSHDQPGEQVSKLGKRDEIEQVLNIVDSDVHEVSPLLPKCWIYKVHEGLRKVKPKAYEPMLVSIGPYHHQNPKVQEMEAYKNHYLTSLLERKGEESMNRYFSELAKLEDKARKCYVHPKAIKNMSSDQFVRMMLRDGCFIIEYFRKITSMELHNDDPIFNVDWIKRRICLDLMLFENQLPYFLLSKLYDMTKEDPNERSFMKMAMLTFNYISPNLIHPSSIRCAINISQEINHLLHLLHVLCRPLSGPTSLGGNIRMADNNELSSRMSVVELQEAGVKFSKPIKLYTDTVNLFDIKFSNGLMTIPRFKVDDSTDTFFRNLIAYEQHFSNVDPKYFTDFAIFMDQLINSEKDVKILRLEGIIYSLLGDDRAVSNLFNKLSEGLIIYSDLSYSYSYSREHIKVNKHCKKPWNRMKATLRHDYFNNIWLGSSTIAAIALLILTLLQTIAAFLFKN